MASPKIRFKQHQVEIIKRCKKDPIFFFNNYVKIQHPDRGAIPFHTYDFQNDVVRDFNTYRFNIVVKARQLGLSTVTAAYAVWLLMFFPNKNILVIATKLSTAQNFIRKCKYMIQNMPEFLRIQDIVSETKTSIETSYGCILKAVPTSEDAGRSEALSLLIVDEAAFIKDFEKLWTGLLPTISSGGAVVLISTPNGMSSYFYKIWSQAEDKINNFNPIKLMWDVHPEHDEEWFKEETKSFDPKKIAQEYECSFHASGDTFIDVLLLEFFRKEWIEAPQDRLGFDKNVWVWKHPYKNHKYILSADTARGDGKDFSAFHVIDCSAKEIVAEYRGKMPPDRFAEIINEIGLYYNQALVCPENNNVGYATIQKLCDLKYPRLYNNKKKTLDIWNSISDQINLYKPSGDLGIYTSGDRKRVILTKMEEMLRNKSIRFYSERLLKELKAFVWLSENKVGASSDANDDLVMSLAIGMWLADTGEGIIENTRDSMSLIKSIQQSSVKFEELIKSDIKNNHSDNNVFMPIASNSAFEKISKNGGGKILSNQWKWLLS